MWTDPTGTNSITFHTLPDPKLLCTVVKCKGHWVHIITGSSCENSQVMTFFIWHAYPSARGACALITSACTSPASLHVSANSWGRQGGHTEGLLCGDILLPFADLPWGGVGLGLCLCPCLWEKISMCIDVTAVSGAQCDIFVLVTPGIYKEICTDQNPQRTSRMLHPASHVWPISPSSAHIPSGKLVDTRVSKVTCKFRNAIVLLHTMCLMNNNCTSEFG